MHRPKNGRAMEVFFFGESVRRRREEKRYLSYREAIEYARGVQERFSWSPYKPKTRMSAELFEKVKGGLSFHYHPRLCLYVSLGTPLDYHWGTDAFFEIINGGKRALVTIDITLLQSKRLSPHKADYFISYQRMRTYRTWGEYFEFIGGRIAQSLTRALTSDLSSWQGLSQITLAKT